tara:strand:- start:1048 stop:1755 length:708 start_codon:yes stop_codon:yes gene_type:complete
VATLKNIIPKHSVVKSYGLFAGKTEISLAMDKRHVNAYTDRDIILHFWYCLFENGARMYDILTNNIFNVGSELEFNILQEDLPTYKDAFYYSSVFFFLNRCSNTGQVSCGKYDPAGLTEYALRYLKLFKKPELFNVFNQSTSEPSPEPDFLLYPNLCYDYNLFDYGKSRSYDTYLVNHKKLRQVLSKSNRKIILVYNFHPKLLSFYENYNTRLVDKYGRVCDNPENYEEAVVTNF